MTGLRWRRCGTYSGSSGSRRALRRALVAEAEVEERWGDTEAYAQSRRRTAAYTTEDWVRITAEGEDLMQRMATALRAGPRL